MIILWNSAEMTSVITLVNDNGEHTTIEWEAGRTLAKNMLAYMRDLLEEHHLTFDDITGIGVFRGPGSYTGLRIALTVLNTFAATQRVPIVGDTSENWQDVCLARIAAGKNDEMVLPEYGGDAHITKPRK